MRFERDYFYHSVVQTKQNQKFLRFLFSVLKDYDFNPQTVAEFGPGDCELVKKMQRVYFLKKVYLIDNNLEFIELGQKGVLNSVGIVKDFRDVKRTDFEEPLDLVVSSNSFHWIPYNLFEKRNFWVELMHEIYDSLDVGGFLVFHHGLRWSYFPLYDIANELFQIRYGRKVDIFKYLFYPSSFELQSILESIGFRFVSQKVFYETDIVSSENNGLEYSREDLYRSFAVAGLNAFLWEIENEKEREKFREDFLILCRIYQPPIFAHRGFFAFRKPFGDDLKIKEKRGDELSSKEIEEVKSILEEVADEFVPSLRVRSPDDKNFNNFNNSSSFKGGGDRYLYDLLSKYVFLMADYKGEIIGFLTYRVKEAVSIPQSRAMYVSTIAVRKRYRKMGAAERFYDYLFEIGRKFYDKLEIDVIETRTWHANEFAINLLKKKGFQKSLVLKDHREKGIDTEYYVYKFE
jgi:ribosomal protein S18 acetylase RimI-like enzyme